MSRLKEAYENCLEKNQLRNIDPAKHVAAKELKEAEFDLEEAHKSFENQNYKWPVIESYYSCFHAARCLLFLIGLKEKSHFCVYAALSAVFNEYFGNEELENYKKAMQRRELADYYASYSKEEAESAINFTEKFIKKVKILYEKLKNLDSRLLRKIRDSLSLKVLDEEKQNAQG